MTTLALVSAKGSPGTTMAALALAVQWPRPVAVVDVDPAGGDVLYRVRDEAGGPLDPDRGLLSIGAALRRGAGETTLADHLQETAFGFPVLCGVPSPEQLAGIGGAWVHLPQVLTDHPGDVLVDAGRITTSSPVMGLVSQADVVCAVVRPDLEGSAHLRTLLRSLQAPLRVGQAGAPQLCVLAVTAYKDTAAVPDLQRLLDHEGLPARVVGALARDDKGARLLSSARVGSVARSVLARSAIEPVERLAATPTRQPGPTGLAGRS
ncbi:hypothetical protein ABFT23_20400 [Nocardioides sp. C4-1]|uniref:hypothetical protein n=1 Tax=Nocardioides sp. C4-1 TaxID=3151851 RepID=UPI0032646CA3